RGGGGVPLNRDLTSPPEISSGASSPFSAETGGGSGIFIATVSGESGSADKEVGLVTPRDETRPRSAVVADPAASSERAPACSGSSPSHCARGSRAESSPTLGFWLSFSLSAAALFGASPKCG